MPEVQETFEIQVHEEGVAQVLRSVLQCQDYRVAPSSLGTLTATRIESGQIFRARKFIRFEVTAHWSAEAQESADDEESPSVKVTLRIAERQNTWTQGRCAEELRQVLAAIPAQVDAFEEEAKKLGKDARYGSAKWSGFEQLSQAGYLTESIEPERLLIGRYKAKGKDFYVSVPKRDAERHALVCGPTGCGKTQTIFVPNLIERTDACAIVTEATPAGQMPDLLKLTAAYRQQHGHKIFYFNPADPRSHCINPIDVVKTISDAQDLADIIIRNTTTNQHVGDQVWETAERLFLAALIMKASIEKGSIADVRKTLTMGRKGLREAIDKAPPSKGKDEALAFFRSTTEGFLNGVLVGLMVRLGPWLIPTVASWTNTTTIDLRVLQEELFTFYLCVPAGARQLKPAAAVILNFLLDRLLDQLRHRDKLKLPTMLLLDELTNFGYIPDLSNQLTILRHAGAQFVLGLQDVEQLRKVYGPSDAKIIFSQPATRIFFKPNEIDTAREISNQLGQATKVDMGRMSVYPRKLLAPEEVLTLDEERSVCFTPRTSPILVWKITPGSYQHAAGNPPLPDPVSVDESLINQPTSDPGMVVSAEANFPKLFREPATEQEQDALLSKQNAKLRKDFGDFKRARARGISSHLAARKDRKGPDKQR